MFRKLKTTQHKENLVKRRAVRKGKLDPTTSLELKLGEQNNLGEIS